MSTFFVEKVVAALPPMLSPSTVYYVRTGSGFDIFVSDMTGAVAHRLNLPDAPPPTDVQVFSTVGTSTWIKPPGAKSVHMILYSPGSGGGSGRRRAVGDSVAASGGGGGAGGGRLELVLPASQFPDIVQVVVGAGGLGGDAVLTDGANGIAGLAGGQTSFGSIRCTAPGGGPAGATTSSSGPFAGMAFPTATNGIGTVSSPHGAGTSLGGSGQSGGNSYDLRGGGGGSGGGISYAGTPFPGGSGGQGNMALANFSPQGGAAVGASGANGYTIGGGLTSGGWGGSGGGAASNAPAGKGGNGGFPGGGGGGGGSSNAGFPSGAGGKGGDGMAVITTYF